MDNEIKVSIALLSYKHAKYIRQCLDSILEQRVNFRYEIIVGDDCSEDGTKEILLEYQRKYPDIFVLLLNEKNLGATRNSVNVTNHIRGQYVCGGESDDYWLDPDRMQKQADFLDAHPEAVAVAGNYCSVDENGENARVILSPDLLSRYYTLEDYLKRGMVLHGNTIMRRREAIPTQEERYKQLRTAEPTMGDVISRVLMYTAGDIYAMPDLFLAHRIGSSAGTSYTVQQRTKMLEHSYMYNRIVDNLTAYLDGRYDLSELKANRAATVMTMMLLGKRKVDRKEFRAYMQSLTPAVRQLARKKVLLNAARKVKKRIAVKLSGRKAVDGL